MSASDPWASWVLERAAPSVPWLAQVRARLLDAGEVAPGQTVLDLGCGDGLVAFGALDRGATVIFSDVSRALLDHCEARLEGDPARPRASFLEAAAEDLLAVDASTVDVVTCRSVLIYVKDKRRALDEVFRILKPGGRLSLFEPINVFARSSPPGTFCGYDLSAIADLAAKVQRVWERPAWRSMLDFDERDLFEHVDRAGFSAVRLTLELSVGRESWLAGSWNDVRAMRPNPLAPSLAEAIAESLSADEAERFERVLRPLVETGEARYRSAHAYLSATK